MTSRTSPGRHLGGARLAAALLLVVSGVLPRAAHAQAPGGATGSSSWPAPVAGLRFGYDQTARGEVVGAQIRVPVLRSGRIEVVPNADITFLTRLREYGYNVDAVFVPGGTQGGIYLGGGLALRNSVFGLPGGDSDRGTEAGFGAVVGARTGSPGRIGTQIEFRWIFLSGVDHEPRAVTLGVNFPLWGRGAGR